MKIKLLVTAGLCLAMGYGTAVLFRKPPAPPSPSTASPMSVVDTISPEAQKLYSKPPSTFVNMDALPMMLKRAALSAYQDKFGAELQQKYGPGVTMTESTLAGVPVRLFQPPKELNPKQVLLNFHGGGFTTDSGSRSENFPIAALTGRKVVAVMYRLGPEHRYPAGVDDAVAVYRKLLETHAPQDIVVYGTSAGATVTAQLAVRLKRESLPYPAGLGMFSMISDFSRPGESMSFLNPLVASPSKEELDKGGQDLMQDNKNLADPLLSPRWADLKGLPPTLLLTGTRDLLMSQTILMHRALLSAGVDARIEVFEGMLHAHWAYLDLPESKDAFESQARFINARLGGQPAS